MKIVINIPKEKYQVIKTAMYARVGEETAKQLIKYIKNGKPLKQEPKTDILDKIRAEIEPKCDRINSLASILPYTAHREIQELLCEIMDLLSHKKARK